MPNPLVSISDFLPKNKLEPLAEFATYPGCYSSLLFAAILPEAGRITECFQKDMKFYNDINGQNMFTMTIERGETKTTVESMKNLLTMSQE